ncbi:hypothetical protein ACRTDU_16380 [Sunxiuqinia elliptica]
MPDMLVALFTFATIFFISLAKFSEKKSDQVFYGLAASIVLFLAFNSKGTIVLTLPLLAYLFIIDLIKKNNTKFWVVFSSSFLFLLMGYFAFWQIQYGDALSRFQAITQNSYLNLCSYADQPLIFTLKRIGYQYSLLTISHSLIIPFIFIFASPATFKKETYQANNKVSFFLVSSLLLLLSSNFMSISITSYSPMCLDPRHYLFIIPVASVAAAFTIKTNFNDVSYRRNLVVFTTIILLIAIINKYETAWTTFFPLTIIFAVAILLKSKHFSAPSLSIALVASVLIVPIKMGSYANKVDFRKQEIIVKEQILSNQDTCIVITDQVQKNIASYLTGFSAELPYSFYTFDEFSSFTDSTDVPVYYLKNWYTSYLSNQDEFKSPYYLKASQYREVVFEDPQLHIQLFRILGFADSQPLLTTKNDFESNTKYWSSYSRNSQTAYTGSYSNQVHEYSSTFKIGIKELNPPRTGQLLIQTGFKLHPKAEGSFLLVLSIEHEKESLLWKGIPLNKQIKYYGNWLPITLNEQIDLTEIPQDATLSIYLWNQNKADLLLDDFEIQLSAI